MAEEDKKLLGSETKEKLLSKISDVGQSISQRAQEDDPDSWSDEAARLAVGTAKTAGAIVEAPVIKQVLQVADVPFYLARQSAGAVLEHGFGVDPWYGQTAVGLGEVALGGKGLVRGARYTIQKTKNLKKLTKFKGKSPLWKTNQSLDEFLDSGGSVDDAIRMAKSGQFTDTPIGTIVNFNDNQRKLFELNDRINFGGKPITRQDFINRVRQGYTDLDPDWQTMQTIKDIPPDLKNRVIQLSPGNEEGALNSIAASIRNHGINPDDLGFKRRPNAKIKGNPGTAYFDYLEQYYAKYNTLEGADRLMLPDGITMIALNESKIRRKIQSLRASGPIMTQGGIFRQRSMEPLIQETLEGYQRMSPDKPVKAVTRKTYTNADDIVEVALEGHHLAGLDFADYLWYGLDRTESAKMTTYLVRKKGISGGEMMGNLGMLDAKGIHLPVHAWMDEFLGKPDQATLDKIFKIKNFEGRKKFVNEFEKNYQRAMKEIYNRNERWLDKNFPDRWRTEGERVYDLLNNRDMDRLVDYLEGVIDFDDVPTVNRYKIITEQVKKNPQDKRWKGPFTTTKVDQFNPQNPDLK